MNPENSKGRQKIDYINNLLNNHVIIDGVFESILGSLNNLLVCI